MKNKVLPLFFALFAAVFYALGIPLSKLLLSTVAPTMMAGLLYSGAGIGVGVLFAFNSKHIPKKELLDKSDFPFVVAMIVLDIAAPILLMFGIKYSTSANSSLLNNFEIVATSIIADIVISGLFVACSLGIIYLFFKTRAGYSVRATGCNPAMARAQGINTDRDIIVALAISNGLAALSGSLLAQINTGATANMGTGAIVIGLAGVVLGEAVTRESFPFGAKLAAVILGSVIYRVVLSLAIQLVTFLTMDDLKLISAVIILAVLAAKRFAPKHKKGKKRQPEVSGGGAEGV